ncbi:MAG: MFS transporter [Bacteroides sp.]|nr:MFS transporter [Bacteroides sp.]
MNSTKSSSLAKLLPIMLCFFAMGFVDLVGIASNYVKADLQLSDSEANIFPSLVFFWFLIFSVPTGMLMNRIGRKKTVLLSLVVTFASLLLPIFGDGYMLMLVSFSLLGIGNALMQTSLNPLLSNIVSGDSLASSLTFGQFVKAIASFLAPYIAMWGATQAIPSLGMGWRVLFPIYMVVAVIAILWLGATSIQEEKEEGRPSTFGECLALLAKPFILLCFLGIMCHVGIDVGTNTTAPKILMERLGMSLDEAGFATSLYFIFRTAGCFLGAFILQKMAARSFFGISVLCMLVAMVGLFIFHDKAVIYVCIALIGFGNSNIFPIIFAQALLAMPQKKNEVSGLMIMGLFGGTVFPMAMGVASDAIGQNGAVAVMTVGVLYLLFYLIRMKK